jgi:hypothetical protein
MALPDREVPCHQGAVKQALSYKKACLVGALVMSGFLALGACSNGGEGDRCESLNGNDDCNTDIGLICTPAALLVGTTSDRCCPADRTQATETVCKTPVSGVQADAIAPTDTGPPPTTTDASVNDAAPEAGDAAHDG